MKRKPFVGLIAMAAVAAALLAAQGSSVRAQPLASMALPDPCDTERTVELYPRCNNIALTFTDGTASEIVVQAVTPPEAVESMWRHDAAQGMWEGYSPAFPEVGSLLTVDFLDVVWLCLAGAPAAAPTATPPPVAPTATAVAPTPISPPPPTATTAPAGYSFTFPSFYSEPDTFRGTVEEIRMMDSIPKTGYHEGVTAPAGSTFALVLMTVQNIGNEPAYVSSFSFRLRDSIGRHFTLSYDQPDMLEVQWAAQDYFQRIGVYDDIQPGITKKMVFGFLVPTGVSGLVAERCPTDGC
jgi:hypothetical protein